MLYSFIKKYRDIGAKYYKSKMKGLDILSMKIKELPELERPYEKLEMYGEKVLSDAELLAIIIKTGTKEETAVQLSQRLLSLNNTTAENLSYLTTLSIQELMQLKGIGKVKEIQLKAGGEIAVRMFKTSNCKKIVIEYPQDLAKTLMSTLSFKKEGVVKVVVLSNKNEVLKIEDVANGTINFVNIPMKDILYEPIRMKAPKFILVHNHPSGDCKPSEKDIVYTECLYETAKLIGIEMMDHIIIGNMRYTSIFTENALRTNEEQDKE